MRGGCSVVAREARTLPRDLHFPQSQASDLRLFALWTLVRAEPVRTFRGLSADCGGTHPRIPS